MVFDVEKMKNRIERIKSVAKMNKELELWIKETEKKGELTKIIEKANEKKIEPMGKCEICGKRDAKFVCIKCHRKVCSSCYFSILGLCKKCISKEVVEKWKQDHPNWKNVLDVEWID